MRRLRSAGGCGGCGRLRRRQYWEYRWQRKSKRRRVKIEMDMRRGGGSQRCHGGRGDPHDLGSRGGRRENEEGVKDEDAKR
jgi:hypothetical protein